MFPQRYHNDSFMNNVRHTSLLNTGAQLKYDHKNDENRWRRTM